MTNEAKFKKVMEEFEAGTLKSSSGETVTSRKQAQAIAHSEASEDGCGSEHEYERSET